jgi:hypothetical protein
MKASSELIGIVGASGVVGQSVAHILRARGLTHQRHGARNVAALTALHDAKSDVGVLALDLHDPGSLEAFCRGCRVIVNCAGPSYLVVDKVARAALAAGADYVDVSGDDPAQIALSHANASGSLPHGWQHERRVILSAGMIAGFSNLLPRWLAARSPMTVTRLTARLGGAQLFTSTAAGDLVLSLMGGSDTSDDSWYGETGAAWRFGKRKSRVLKTSTNATLPHFRGAVTVQPFLSSDAVRLATAMGLAEMDWYNVFAGEQLRSMLSRLRGRTLDQAQLRDAIEQARTAAELDLAGRQPWYTMVFELGGFRAGRPIVRSAVARTEDTYLLTAGVAALAVEDVLANEIAPGLHFADDALRPDLVDRARDVIAPAGGGSIVSVETFEAPGLASAAFEDGCL